MATEPDFTQFCNLLPPDSYWGDPVTPAMVGHIATAHAASLEAEIRRLRYALQDIADMTYDRWTNGARAGDIAMNVLNLPVNRDSEN